MIGARIAALRRQKKLSQQALARQVGVRPSAIGMYEQGRMRRQIFCSRGRRSRAISRRCAAWRSRRCRTSTGA